MTGVPDDWMNAVITPAFYLTIVQNLKILTLKMGNFDNNIIFKNICYIAVLILILVVNKLLILTHLLKFSRFNLWVSIELFLEIFFKFSIMSFNLGSVFRRPVDLSA